MSILSDLYDKFANKKAVGDALPTADTGSLEGIINSVGGDNSGKLSMIVDLVGMIAGAASGGSLNLNSIIGGLKSIKDGKAEAALLQLDPLSPDFPQQIEKLQALFVNLDKLRTIINGYVATEKKP